MKHSLLNPSFLLFKLDENILHIKCESFCGFDVDMSLSKDSCVEYESFSIDPIQTDLLFEYCKSAFVESDFVTKNFTLAQTHM